MERQYKVCGLGNAIVDVLTKVTNEELSSLGYEKATMRLVEEGDQTKLLTFLEQQDKSQRSITMASGGSVANSIIAFAQLGGAAAFIGTLGDDGYGRFYREEFRTLGVELRGGMLKGGKTGTSAVLITPDAERTMRTCLGSAALLNSAQVDEEIIAHSEWLFIEGYLFANPTHGQTAVTQAIAYAKKHSTKIAVTCSEAFVVEVFGEALHRALESTDLVFANASEAMALSKTNSAEDAFAALSKRFASVAVTASEKGAYVSHAGRSFHVPAQLCTPVDLTGAGDMFAGSLLYAITHEHDIQKAARASCYLSMKVITQIGARLHHGTRKFWEEVAHA